MDMKWKKKKKEAIATMPHLPEEILREILLRLPTRSVSRFKCVSKSFSALFRSPSFQSLHHELSNIKNDIRILICDSEPKEVSLYTIDYKSISCLFPLSTSSSATTTMCEFQDWMDFPSLFVIFKVDLLSSCNGLVWISLYHEPAVKQFYIWNPSTEVFKNIPEPPDEDIDWEDRYDVDGYGFCYDHKIDNYKCLRVLINDDSKCSDVHVYTLGSDSWRRIQGIPYHLYHMRSFAVLLNGALHWLALTFGEDQSTLLVRFDIINERFQEVALPEAPMPYPVEYLNGVAVLGGCLCLIFHVYKVRVDILTMQDYGVRESWTKSFSITQESITSSRCLELIWSFKNNEILWEVQKGVFILYEPMTKTCRKMVLGSVGRRYIAARHYMIDSVLL